MKFPVIVLLSAVAACADTVTVTYNLGPSALNQECGSQQTCAPILFDLPQFSGPGDLTEVDWSITDHVQYYGGINDMYQAVGSLWTASFSVGDQSAVLGLDASTGYSESGVVYGNGTQISMGGWWTYGTVKASGSALDLTPFLGDRTLQLAVTPFATARGTGAANAGITQMRDTVSLQVTYVDPSPVPEPRWIACAIAALMGAAVYLKRRRRSPFRSTLD